MRIPIPVALLRSRQAKDFLGARPLPPSACWLGLAVPLLAPAEPVAGQGGLCWVRSCVRLGVSVGSPFALLPTQALQWPRLVLVPSLLPAHPAAPFPARSPCCCRRCMALKSASSWGVSREA